MPDAPEVAALDAGGQAPVEMAVNCASVADELPMPSRPSKEGMEPEGPSIISVKSSPTSCVSKRLSSNTASCIGSVVGSPMSHGAADASTARLVDTCDTRCALREDSCTGTTSTAEMHGAGESNRARFRCQGWAATIVGTAGKTAGGASQLHTQGKGRGRVDKVRCRETAGR